MKLTYGLLHGAGTKGIGFNCQQLKILGVKWPPKAGWLTSMIGREVPDQDWELIMRLKGKRRDERRAILRSTMPPETQQEMMNRGPRKRELEARLSDALDFLKGAADLMNETVAYGSCDCNIPDGFTCISCESALKCKEIQGFLKLNNFQ